MKTIEVATVICFFAKRDNKNTQKNFFLMGKKWAFKGYVLIIEMKSITFSVDILKKLMRVLMSISHFQYY